MVRCDICGVRFLLSARNVRGWQRRGREPRCSHCRWPHPSMTDEEREKFMVWWLYSSGLDVEELLEAAVALGELA